MGREMSFKISDKDRQNSAQSAMSIRIHITFQNYRSLEEGIIICKEYK
jgi:hypothetical protein